MSAEDFIGEVTRLIAECERRDGTDDLSVIKYMLRRIRSCYSALMSIKTGIDMNIEEALSFDQGSIQGLIDCFNEIETDWSNRKETAESNISSEGSSYLKAEFVYTGNRGRPRFILDADFVAYLNSLNFSTIDIAKICGTSRTTIWRYFGALKTFSDITDVQLDEKVSLLKRDHPDVGERMLNGLLVKDNINVQRRRLRESIHRTDPVNTALRWMRRNPRWIYSVPGPNSLWHNDGLHKLIRYGFVIHGVIDGYSRMATSLLCATNNRAETCLIGFLQGVERYGLPERVRGDNGSENNDIEKYMFNERGGGSYLRGPSVHNQRIERLHKDTTAVVLSHFINLFKFLEDKELLRLHEDLYRELDLFCLHFTYTRRIQASLDRFREGWNSHSLSTCRNRSPIQLWMLGMMDDSKKEQVGVQSALSDEELRTFGIEMNEDMIIDEEETVELDDVYIGNRHDEIYNLVNSAFDPIQEDGNYGVNMYCDIQHMVYDLCNSSL